ncbi:unnamed protein product [Urochloa decumbens]|uniref:Protein kinase domain-containing protein n=1 Tax=Urochloa decumbens TaxID=240449 RepID=A0ABC9B736_9POAL
MSLTMKYPSYHGRWPLGPPVQLAVVAPLLALHLLAASAATPPPPMGLPGCPTRCGNMTVPYPFGISADCSLPGFNLTCDHGHSPPKLLLGDGATGIEVTGIFLQNATVRVVTQAIIAEPSMPGPTINNTWGLGVGEDIEYDPIALSHDRNKLIALGCGVQARLLDGIEEYFIAECSSSCSGGDLGNWLPDCRPGLAAAAECSGNGCCQASIPQYSPSYKVRLMDLGEAENFYAALLPTVIVFIAEQGWIEGVWCQMIGWKPQNLPIIPPPELLSMVPVLLEWAMNSTPHVLPGLTSVKDSKCPTDGVSSACKSNHSSCIIMNSFYRIGYACRCSPGYDGNPYLIDGCQDIDECADPDHYPCYGECTNLPGTYQCRCPRGSQGNSSVIHGCVDQGIQQSQRKKGLSIGLGVGSGAMLLILTFITILVVRRIKARRKKKLRKRFFKQNHGKLLQQLVCNRADIGERMIITLEELEKATNNFDSSRELGGGGHGIVYKGILSSQHVVAIKKSKIVVQKEINEFINEVAILSQVNHRNIVKLIGCCLETEVPLLVYEFVSNGTLFDHLHVEGPISMAWKDRMRIAVEIARSITYLHSFASTPIIHRDIKSPNILLDDNLVVKLSDFGASRYIPIDQEGIHTAVQGTLGYLDPMYNSTGHLTDKSDVYSFGVVLIELLTRKKPVSYRSSQGLVLVNHFVSLLSEGNLDEILDSQVTKEGDGEVIDIALLAAICVKFRGEERPTMRQVEMTLESIYASKEFSSDVTDVDISSETI